MSNLAHIVTLDFETEAIVGNPIMYPPKPVGLAVTLPNMDTEYYTGEAMVQQAYKHWASGVPLCFHNAPFDLSVAREWFGLEFPHWSLVHDTTYLVFLKNPHAASLSLKPSADYYLDLPPQEQDDLKEWILANVPEATTKSFGAYICRAPVELVTPYAKGDTIRTRGLFDLLHPQVPTEPYDRERELMPILVAATRKGVRVNRQALGAAYDQCKQAQERCEQLIQAKLGVAGLNPHSGPELAHALESSGYIAPEDWVLTPTGKKSIARDNLIAGIKDPGVLNLLIYTGAMQTALGTFMEPWLEKSYEDGRLHPNWNQVRQPNERGKGIKGTRTGRLSSDDPNLQNVPNPFDFELPDGLAEMPHLRDFLLPEEGHSWLKRDFSGQEMRILAHFEDGPFQKAYQDNPNLDPHTLVMNLIHDKVGKLFKRKFIKETGFGMIYGMGAPGLAKKIGGGMTVGEARELQSAYKSALPGVEKIQRATKQRGRSGQCVTTWGGRQYLVEEPRIVGGSYRSFEYKLTNYLIQGSAADQTKQVTIDWHNGHNADISSFLVQVHDEINISAEIGRELEVMQHLRECMEQDFFDVPMRSDSFMGPDWGHIEEYDDGRWADGS